MKSTIKNKKRESFRIIEKGLNTETLSQMELATVVGGEPCGAFVCGANGCGINACGGNACGGNICGVQLCPVDLCPVDACIIDLFVQEDPNAMDDRNNIP